MTRLNVDGARCEALFASELQRPDAPTAESVTEAISRTVRRLGTRGCAGSDGTRVRRPPPGGRRADALDPPARRRDDHRQMASLGPEPPGRSRGLAARRA